MLTTTKHAARPATAATLPRPARALQADLDFVAANERLEGLPGNVAEEVASHQPNVEAIASSARHFGAHVPREANRSQPAVFREHRPKHR
ncbi:MAG: hypothetical protein HS113_22865 [Verrucomicrobiales bacterium]|nr:hypothetical protein [Verrucomicrobiales bacterium]